MVTNPSRNIPYDYSPEPSLAHVTKEATGGFAPLSPYETAGQSTEKLLQLLTGVRDRSDAG